MRTEESGRVAVAQVGHGDPGFESFTRRAGRTEA